MDPTLSVMPPAPTASILQPSSQSRDGVPANQPASGRNTHHSASNTPVIPSSRLDEAPRPATARHPSPRPVSTDTGKVRLGPANGLTHAHQGPGSVGVDGLPRTGATKSRLSQAQWSIGLLVAAFLYSSFLSFYLIEALVSTKPHLGSLLSSPPQTLLQTEIFLQVFILLLHGLVSDALDTVRRRYAARPDHQRALTFLTLSPATSLMSALRLFRVPGWHCLWFLVRAFLVLLFLFMNVVVKGHVTIHDINTPIRTRDVFAGLTPFNISLLQSGQVPNATIGTFFTGFVESIDSDSKYVTAANHVGCSGPNCTSVFLPGGLNQVRLLGSDLNGTLYQADILKDADSVVIYNAPGYQLDFYPPAEGFAFDPVRECSLYGRTRHNGLYLCVGSDEEKNLVAGWSVCPSPLYLIGACFNDTSWTEPLQEVITLSAIKRYADTTYDAGSSAILNTVLHPDCEAVAYDPPAFRDLFRTILADHPSNTTYASDASIAVDQLLYGLGIVLRMYHDLYPDDSTSPRITLQNMLTIPIQFTTAAWQYANASSSIISGAESWPLPSDLQTTAVATYRTARLLAARWTVYTFIAVSFVTWIVCLMVFVYKLMRREDLPDPGGIAELGLMARVGTAQYRDNQEERSGTIRAFFWGNSVDKGKVDALRKILWESNGAIKVTTEHK